MTSEGFHEPRELLSQVTQDRHRAIVSLMEELEAVDWYAQRVDATSDPELKKILQHNLEEEIEHAVMVLEWLRRSHPKFDEELRGRLFREGPIVTPEHGSVGEVPSAHPRRPTEGATSPTGSTPPSADGSLGIGALRGR
jgi:uncharacterized protein